MLYIIFLPLFVAAVVTFAYAHARRRATATIRLAPTWPEYPCSLIHNTGILSRPEIPPNHYAIRNAQVMALTHNTIFRGLNAIHTQALAVKPGTKDARDILSYAMVVYDFVHAHHIIEERIFFPKIEAATGEKGLMEENVEQHKKLEAGLESLRLYAVDTKPEHYSGFALRDIIESLAGCLVEHLHEEIPTILNLWNKIPSEELRLIYKAMHDEAERSSNWFKAGPFVLGCQDKTFLLDGKSIDFPELPSPAVNYLFDWIMSKRHARLWRFNPSNMYYESRATDFYVSKLPWAGEKVVLDILA